MLNIVIKSLWETIFLQHRQYIQLILFNSTLRLQIFKITVTENLIFNKNI